MIGSNGTDTGVYAVAAGAALNLVGGTRTFDTGSDVTGAGSLTVSGATVNANVPLSLASNTGLVISSGTVNFNSATPVSLPSLVLAGGTLAGTGAVTVTGEFDVTSTSLLTGPAC